jgi:hypothetical protein
VERLRANNRQSGLNLKIGVVVQFRGSFRFVVESSVKHERPICALKLWPQSPCLSY